MKICVVGLGYVGLPLLFELSKKFEVTGIDINKNRIDDLNNNIDSTNELTSDQLKELSCDLDCGFKDGFSSDVYIVTVPTPVDDSKVPDLSPVLSACRSIAEVLKKGDLVVFESTVYPGCTEEECVPILKSSGLEYITDFGVGYSPERINPGDKKNTVKNVNKIISASSEKYLTIMKEIYGSFLKPDSLFVSLDIRHAEMSKVFENTQRDVNIALVNELSLICKALGLETHRVLEACRTKWNFLDFRPGLVGGHCIGVDPYYLIHRANKNNFFPEVISAARRTNEKMVENIVNDIFFDIVTNDIKKPKISILGLTFKENCPDARNSKSIDLVEMLIDKSLDIYVHDPLLQADEFSRLNFKSYDECLKSDIIIIAVAHEEYKNKFNNEEIIKKINKNAIIYDLKSIISTSVPFKVRSL